MSRLSSRATPWLAIAAMAWCALVQPVHATTSITHPAQFLDQAEKLRTADHPQFVRMLEQIHQETPRLNASEQWQLRYLDAWETMYEGNYAKSEIAFRDVIDHSGNTILAAKASGLLLNNLALNRRYEEGFALANRLTSDLPSISDPNARFILLTNLSQMLDFAGQIDLAIQYARMAQDIVPRGESLCRPLSMQVAALYNGKRLTSSSPILQQAIDSCSAAREPVFTNVIWLTLGSLYLDENQPDKAMALLDRIAPAIIANHYYPHMLSSQVERAQAYAKLGNDQEARKAALTALAMSHPGDISEWLMTAYDVLYHIEKKNGHNANALSYYEHYVAQSTGNLNDITARTLAYEMAQQHTLVQKLETETLSKQNNILRLEQALDKKAVETSRLYIVLLLVALVSIIYWLFRLKRSQLRFKQLSSLDGLTGILNHQNFMSEADRALHALEKKQGSACLVYVDLDYFKQVNDTHGHAVGDAVLRRTVAICRHHLRPTDLFGRLGGEEFGILLHDCSSHQGMAIADRIRGAIEAASVDGDGSAVSFSASVGLASTNVCGYSLQKLCREADAALYRAKRSGRNRVIANTENGDLVEA
ncbi:tetratricopeptide repeat-containing diguanylate cyclase [Dyella psychrodurans]|uniref:diguanylate cyclase n=1 Tax=Dyella psychrodurans TaxID=1927960 RepID=A0A370XD44_9GAMM|nr:diguanylate cyclase [Dyella psychrodurans]RDS86190.1 diguanylate cyclase [Dyella psychrodurans]